MRASPQLRGQPGQIRVAAAIRDLLDGSEIVAQHVRCGKVQDPYSFRCQPQVMGAALDLLENAARTLTIEAAAVTDNPVVFPDEDSAISGGNFHAQPVAFAADMIAMALCEVGSLSERRTAVLIDPKMSGLPPFLTAGQRRELGPDDPAGHRRGAGQREQEPRFSGERRFDSDLGGAGGPCLDGADRRAQGGQIARNAAGVVAVELIAAAQGIDCHAPLKTSPKLQALHAKVRELSPHLVSDRYWADDMAALQSAVLAGEIVPGLSPVLTG